MSSSGSSSTSGRSSAQGSSNTQGRSDQGQEGESTFLNTALESGKKWIEDSHVLDSVNQLPQSVKDWGTRAVSRVGSLSTTQKVVGGALLAAGLGWLAMRKGKSGSTPSVYGRQSGSYGRSRTGYGYQAPDASNRRPAATGSRSSSSPSFENSTNLGSDRRSTSGYGGASSSDYGSRTSEGSSYSSRSSESSRSTDSGYGSRSGDNYRSIE